MFFLEALRSRDRLRAGAIMLPGLYVAAGRTDPGMDRPLDNSFRTELNRRCFKHLRQERPYLFSLFYCPDLDATHLL